MEFAPIFAPGFHDITVGDLDQHFVTPFSNPVRNDLTGRLKDFITKLLELDFKGEIWLDGSYTTMKPEPGDIDMVVVFDVTHINGLTIEKKNTFKNLIDHMQTKIRYNCDAYWVPSNNVPMVSYWRGWYGFSRLEVPKGIVRIKY
jgi:hypothetical protein